MCGSFRSLALHPGAHGALGSRGASPQLNPLPTQKEAPTAPAPNLALGQGQNLGHIPTAHGDTTADPAPDHGPIITDLTVGPTAESVGAEATAIHPCPIVGGTLATVLIQIRIAAWESLA